MLTDDELISRWIEPGFHRTPDDARIKEHGVHVWALVNYFGLGDLGVKRAAHEYDLPFEAVAAARAYYHRYRSYLDARVLLNTAPTV